VSNQRPSGRQRTFAPCGRPQPWQTPPARSKRIVYKGRKPSIDAGEILRLRREERLGPSAIARRLSIGRASVYRLLGKHDAATQTKGSGSADQA
jgi:DNA invertase Pin-like site-specific DNA recombinase